MAEPDAVKRIDDLAGDVGHHLGLRPTTERNLEARRANSFWVSAGLRLEVELGEHLGEPAVEEDPGVSPAEIVGRPAPPQEQPLAQPEQQLARPRPRARARGTRPRSP